MLILRTYTTRRDAPKPFVIIRDLLFITTAQKQDNVGKSKVPQHKNIKTRKEKNPLRTPTGHSRTGYVKASMELPTSSTGKEFNDINCGGLLIVTLRRIHRHAAPKGYSKTAKRVQ
jgi:hypothetical protein